MKWGEYVVFVVKEDGSNGNFFTGTKRECELVKFGIELKGGQARLVKPERGVAPIREAREWTNG